VTRRELFNYWLPQAFRFILAAIFITAAIPKIMDPAKFAQDIGNYRLIPHEWNNLLAITLPWVELVAAVLLAAGVWGRASAWLITGMMIMFLVVIASAIWRGLNIECGCFGTVSGRRIGLRAVALDTALLIMALWICWRPAARRTEPISTAAEPA
jgi:uncharacterized membrane protein YphA (DoxX/SURF4 family)